MSQKCSKNVEMCSDWDLGVTDIDTIVTHFNTLKALQMC